MKNKTLISIISLLCLLIVIPNVLAQVDYLTNGSFEINLLGWDSTNDNVNTFFATSEYLPYDGSYCANSTIVGVHNFNISQTLDLNLNYYDISSFTFQYKYSSTGTAIYVYISTDKGDFLLNTLGTQADWNLYNGYTDITNAIDINSITFIYDLVINVYSSSTGTKNVYLDDFVLQVEQIAPTPTPTPTPTATPTATPQPTVTATPIITPIPTNSQTTSFINSVVSNILLIVYSLIFLFIIIVIIFIYYLLKKKR